MRTTIVLAFLLIASLSIAQNPHTDFKYALKLSNLSSLSLDRIRDSQGNNIGGTYLNMFQPIPGFMYRTKKGNFNEISLNFISFNSSFGRYIEPQSQRTAFALGGSLGKQIVFLKTKQSPWVPMLGLYLAPSFYASHRAPMDGVFQFRSAQQLGVEALVSPRLAWFSKKRFFMDFSIPISLASLNFIHYFVQMPSTTQVTEETRLNLHVLNPRLMAQVGFGIKL